MLGLYALGWLQSTVRLPQGRKQWRGGTWTRLEGLRQEAEADC